MAAWVITKNPTGTFSDILGSCGDPWYTPSGCLYRQEKLSVCTYPFPIPKGHSLFRPRWFIYPVLKCISLWRDSVPSRCQCLCVFSFYSFLSRISKTNLCWNHFPGEGLWNIFLPHMEIQLLSVVTHVQFLCFLLYPPTHRLKQSLFFFFCFLKGIRYERISL